MKWTEAQQSAIDAPKPSDLSSQTLLVAAAAGSGKTAVLVERIIEKLRTKQISVQELLVATFTKAAAAEMKSRIALKLAEEYEKTQDPYLEEQLNLLPSAHISTLHSFCQWVIKNYFYRLDMDPNFRIGNDGELALMRYEVLESVLKESYEQNLYGIYDLGDMFGDNRSDEGLIQLVLQMYFFAIAQGNPRGWLNLCKDQYMKACDKSVEETPWGQYFWEEHQLKVERLMALGEEIHRLAALGEGYEKWLEATEKMMAVVEMMHRATSWQSMYEATILVDKGVFSKIRDNNKIKADPALRTKVRAAIDECKDILTSMVGGPLTMSEDMVKSENKSLSQTATGLVDLTLAFYDAYDKRKSEEGVIDFSDLEHRALALLRDESGNPSEVAEELRENFKEVMVDEYQDTSGVQEAIINCVAKEENRFYVGDVKQSIYRFRMADPSLFMDKYHRFGKTIDSVERRIDLSQNFRSHENILAFTNFIFRQIMVGGGMELAYGDEEALYPGREVKEAPSDWVGGSVEVHLLDVTSQETAKNTPTLDEEETPEEELEYGDQEIAFIIDKMKELKDSQKMVQEKNGEFRPIQWRDMVVLLRSVSAKANRMVDMMREAGIPAYAEARSGYFGTIEVQLMLSLLQIIDNPEQDLPMSIVLHSPLVGMDANDLGQLRLLAKDQTLYHGLADFALRSGRDEWQDFVGHLERWRTMSRRQRVSDVLWDIFETLHFVEYVSAMPNGIVRRANMMALYERAKQFEAGNFRGLFRFLRFMESLQQSGQDLSMANTVSEADDVVRIMSIHKSKGLEFPVVFLASTQKKFNEMDLRSPVLMHKDQGLAIKGYYPDLRVMYPSLPWRSLKQIHLHAMKAEEARILYVALTRAKDKLFITGYFKGENFLAKHVESALTCQTPELTEEIALDSKSYLDWLLAGMVRHLEGGILLRQAAEGVEDPAIPPIKDKDCHIELMIHEKPQRLEEVDTKDYHMISLIQGGHALDAEPLPETVVDRLSYVYPHEPATAVPAKISVSEIKRRYSEIDEEALQGVPVNIEEELKEMPIVEATLADKDSVIESSGEVETREEQVDLGAFGVKPAMLTDQEEVTYGAHWGTLMHEAMQWLPVQSYTRKSLREALDALALRGYFTAEERAVLNEYKLYQFFHSDLGKRMITSPRCEKELPFSRLYPAERIYEGLEGEELFVQGIIDTAFLEDDEWVLVDYKTDRVKTGEELIERYKVQLSLYKDALETLTHKKVKEVYIYSFALERAVQVIM